MEYYKEKIKEIKFLIQNNKIQQAQNMLFTELSMPYIPVEFEKEFRLLKQKINSLISEKKLKKIYSKKQLDINIIFEIIISNNHKLLPIALSQLKDVSLIVHWKKVSKIFQNKEISNYVKIVIWEYLVEQKIYKRITIKTQYDEKSLIPKTSLSNSESYKKIITKLDALLLKNPTLYNVAISYVNNFIINFFPNEYEYGEEDEKFFIWVSENSLNNTLLSNENFIKHKYKYIYSILKRNI